MQQMFPYNDPIYQMTNDSPTKSVDFQDLVPTTASSSHTNEPLYPFNDMTYSIDHRQAHPSLDIQQQQHTISSQQQPIWQDSPHPTPQPQQSYYSDLSVDHPSYSHYNVSPFSSPAANTSMVSSTSQRSSLQSLPLVHPIPSASASIQQHPHLPHQLHPNQRPRITTSLWDDEETVCYQVDVRGICVARRQDNDMINGTKLLNVTGMSRGKRDGILKNEKGRVVVKVGAMHLKGVWVTFTRAKALAIQHNIIDQLHPLFVDDPAMYFYSNQIAHNYYVPNHPIYLQSQDSFSQQQAYSPSSNKPSQHQPPPAYMYSNHHLQSTTTTHSNSNTNTNYHAYPSSSSVSSYHPQQHDLPAAPSVPSMIPAQQQQQQQQQQPPQMSLYGYTNTSMADATHPSLAAVDTIMNPF